MAKINIFRFHRSVDDARLATLEVIPPTSTNNPQYVYAGYVNDAKVAIVNKGERVLCFWTPLGKNKDGKIYRHYSRALVEVDGTPEQIAEKVTALTLSPFDETYYNEATRKASFEYYKARQEEIGDAKEQKRTAKPKQTMTKAQYAQKAARLQKQLAALKRKQAQ